MGPFYTESVFFYLFIFNGSNTNPGSTRFSIQIGLAIVTACDHSLTMQ